MEQNIFFVKPRIGFYQTFDDAFKPESDYIYFEEKTNDWNFDIFFKHPKSFIVAEPGFGKTVLLEKIAEYSKQFNKKSIYVDCKQILESTIESYILKQMNSNNEKKIENDENIVICFNALDEVRFDDFSQIIEKIKVFIDTFNKVFIILSCRRHYFFKHRTIFNDYDFRFIRIFPFNIEQINEYLLNHSILQNDIEKVINLLAIRDNDLIIQTPRYLSLLTLYIEGKSIDEIESITRADLFEYFIYNKLKIEGEKVSGVVKEYYKDVFKRILEKLALIMEIYQANVLTKDDLVTFFDDIRSNLTLIMQDRITLNMLFEKSVLKDFGDRIEFENTEFHEYLAAKEILRLGKNKRILFELAIEPEIKEIRPSWFNTLQFLVDMDITLLKPLLNFNKKESLTENEEYHKLLTIVNVNRLSTNDREEIFIQVFDYYQKSCHWIDWDVAQNLSHYFTNSHIPFIETQYKNALSEKDNERQEVDLSNIAKIVGYVVTKNGFETSLESSWKKRLIEFANNISKKKVLSRIAIYSLSNFKDDSVIGKIGKAWENGDKLVRDAFLNLCKEVNPNHQDSIEYFIQGTVIKAIYARYGIWSITDRKAIIKLLNTFNIDEDFLFKFIDHESIFKDRDDQIIKNIRNVLNTEVANLLHQIIITAFSSNFYYQAEHSKFLNEIAQLLKEMDKYYIFSLIEEIKKNEKFTYSITAVRTFKCESSGIYTI
jgi:hypothetical protein